MLNIQPQDKSILENNKNVQSLNSEAINFQSYIVIC